MRDMGNGGTWYGQIQSSRGNIIVISDDQLPAANKGRIYLYNTERDAIVEYDEAIVSPKLVALSEEEAQQVKAKFDKAWEITRKQFIRAQTKASTATSTKDTSADDLLPLEDDVLLDDDDDD